MRKTLTIALLAIFLTSCSSTSIVPPQLTETAKSVCNLYENAKPKVIALREWAKLNWDAKVPGTDTPVIPSNVKATLKEFDSYLPEIDAAGKLICSFTGNTPTPEQSALRQKIKNVDWDKVLSATVKVVDLAVQYQAKKNASFDGWALSGESRVASLR